jgi:diphosphomevalonate decarboxylase
MSSKYIGTARAHSNIAFIKYWGNIDHELRLPANSSISMNLSDLYTTTTVEWSEAYRADSLKINEQIADGEAIARVSKHLQRIRDTLEFNLFANVESNNNFPIGTGIASSAAAFAALTLAAVEAANETLSERELSTLARCGSGSASRSIPSGFVEWHYGDTHESSYAETFVDHDYWDLVDVIAIISRKHKKTGSFAGHGTADTSILQTTRVNSAEQRLQIVKETIKKRDFTQFAEVIEEDSNLMHAVMMTSRPPLFYWQPLSIEIMTSIREWRERDGIQVCYTLDAGPNVHCICVRSDAEKVISKLKELSRAIEIRVSPAGRGAYIVENES